MAPSERSRAHSSERRPPDIRQPVCSYRQGIPSRTRAELRSTQDGEDGAHEQDDNRDPYEEVSAAHGGRSDAAEPEQRRDDRDDDEDERVVNKVSGHGVGSPG